MLASLRLSGAQTSVASSGRSLKPKSHLTADDADSPSCWAVCVGAQRAIFFRLHTSPHLGAQFGPLKISSNTLRACRVCSLSQKLSTRCILYFRVACCVAAAGATGLHNSTRAAACHCTALRYEKLAVYQPRSGDEHLGPRHTISEHGSRWRQWAGRRTAGRSRCAAVDSTQTGHATPTWFHPNVSLSACMCVLHLQGTSRSATPPDVPSSHSATASAKVDRSARSGRIASGKQSICKSRAWERPTSCYS